MRLNSFALAAGLMLAAATPAAAQIQPDVTVNPNASGTQVLLYPGGKYGRVVRPLLQPGERDPNAPILLHMPRKHVRHVAQAKPKPKVATTAPAKEPATQDTVSVSALPKESAASLLMDEPVKQAQAKPKPAPQKQIAAIKPPPKPAAAPRQAPPKQIVAMKQPPPKKNDTSSPQDVSAFVLSGDQSQSAATPPPAAPQPAPPPARVASVAPGGAELSKRSSILFAPGAEEPPPAALDSVKAMTASLTAALWSGTAHVQLEAFGGKPGDKSSDARRLSLKRALIVRQLLIDDGIPSERIVVRAMGGASDGSPDRVDIFVAA
ncbi:MAG TPA: OmpA family protein [Rhizomicrobium sp.]|nr:OmpA family protein [Rhizomicrobium sp.]